MDKKPSIFLSHSHLDKQFVRQLAEDLSRYDVKVWLDEAEMGIGDSLIEKIREGIDSMDYLGAVISQHSVKSPWVRREIDVAMNQEIEGRRLKVLPILIDDCDLPGFLLGKIYADFRKPEKYSNSLDALLKRFGIEMYASPMLKHYGVPTRLPPSAFTFSKYLKFHIAFFDGNTFYFGYGAGPMNAPGNTKVGDLIVPMLLKFYDVPSFDQNTLRILHIQSESWVEDFRTLGEAGVDNGDYLVYTFGKGSSIRAEGIAALFSLALEQDRGNSINSTSSTSRSVSKPTHNSPKRLVYFLIIGVILLIAIFIFLALK
jgi:hypothetical protein